MKGDYNPVDRQGKRDCFDALSHLGQAGLMSLINNQNYQHVKNQTITFYKEILTIQQGNS